MLTVECFNSPAKLRALRADFNSTRHPQYLGGGLYSYVFWLNSELVLKVGYNDRTREYLELCADFTAAGHFPANTPRVFGIRSVGQRMYAAIMERLQFTRTRADNTWPQTPQMIEAMAISRPSADGVLRRIDFGHDACDAHGGNWMWSSRRKEWVLTDPCAGSYEGHGITTPLPKSREAQWKTPAHKRPLF